MQVAEHARRALFLGAMLAGLAGCAHRTASSSTRPLRVLVYNIHAGRDEAGRDNLDGVASLVHETGADIAIFQEVDQGTSRSGGQDQPAELARRTGFNAAFGPSLESFEGGKYGIAILSRWPIVADSVVHLVVTPPQERAGGSHEPRVALRIVVASPYGRLAVFDTHLDPLGNDHWRRQEAAIVAASAGDARADAEAVLVGGDFNSTPESAVQARVRASGLTDAWQTCGSGPGLSYPADTPVKRIDYLFIAGAVRCRVARVIDTQVSDHRPVLFELSVE